MNRNTPTPPPALAPALAQWVIARLGQVMLAIDARWIESAQRASDSLVELPRRRGPLAGLLPTVHGLVPVVDIARWVRMRPSCSTPLDLPADPEPAKAEPYFLVLREQDRRLGLRVDALMGVRHIDAGLLHRVHQQEDDEELFDAVIQPEDNDTPLCVLEPRRLMALLSIWMDATGEAGTALAIHDATLGETTQCTQGKEGAQDLQGAGTVSAESCRNSEAGMHVPTLALMRVGGHAIAVEAASVAELLPMPPLSSRLDGGHATMGSATWRGRNVPALDPARVLQLDTPVDGTPLAVVLRDDQDRHLLLPVDELLGSCPAPAQLSEPAAHAAAWRGGRWIHAGELVELLDAQALLDRLLETEQSHAGKSEVQRREHTNRLPHMLLQAGRAFAVPATDLVAIVEAPAPGSTVLSWHDHQLPVRALPGVEQGNLLALLNSGSGLAALRIERLLGVLPAHAAERVPMPGRPGHFVLATAEPRASYVVRTGQELAAESAPVC